MAKWYVESVYTHDDSNVNRRRKYGEFETDQVSVNELAILALVSTGWCRENAESAIDNNADIYGTTVENGEFEFDFWDNDGKFGITVSQEPITKAVAYVVMVNGQPVAVRSWAPKDDDVSVIANRMQLKTSDFLIVKVEDVY